MPIIVTVAKIVPEGWSRLLQIQVHAELAGLAAKVEAGERLSAEEGYRLLRSADLMTLGYMADLVRRRINGDLAYFSTTPALAADETVGVLAYDGTVIATELVDRIVALRALQADTGRMLCVRLEAASLTTGVEDMKVLAVARILLDNVPHMQPHAAAMGPKMVQATLAFGADDLGNVSPAEAEEMAYLLRQAGRTPVERDTQYNSIKMWA